MNANGRKWRVGVAVLVCGLAFSTRAAPTSEQVRKATQGYVKEGNQLEGIDTISNYLSQQLGKASRISTRELGQLGTAADCVRFMEISRKAKVAPATAQWILASGQRLHQVVDMLDPSDKAGECFRIMGLLKEHDPAGSADYFDLVLAIAVVMDQGGKGRMHGQMGRDLLPVETDPAKVYDYFKALYSSGAAKIDYAKLGASELIFVVVPAPMGELLWARQNVAGSLSGWDEKYSDIDYDHARLNGSRFSWDRGTYTLKAIEEQGGICVDQAYYAVLTARAHGIPAIYFHGSGKSANHAWFAYMKGQGDWLLDVGRYQGDSYTTGYAIHPQTRRQMTDHDVEYTCERSLHSADATQASAYVSIAEVLKGRDPDAALRCARLARELSKKLLRAWEIELGLLVQQRDFDGLTALFADKKDAFREYPDILVESARQIETVLRKNGRNDEADQLMRSAAGAVDDDRDDISRSFENQRINQIIASGDMKKARKELEQMLDDQKDQGNKIFGLIRQYIKLTKDSGQTREAVKFLEGYVEDLVEEYHFPPAYEEGLLELLLSVYQNDGDTKEAEQLKIRIERLRLQQNT
ncbi:hypothetical protein PDESU_01278 [Pontiella desulfatans]|uniref:Transglutaminase-like domain-containing protein n=1 Tax=Pontiella desulfatans TaxID=2750659 RepID=A0A6C2TZ34_PONDE|nr:hypothetical protein [Pontiella desulfatans]VGO12724.1 hypothetical protein PDESU_01278 [Pontiella desulfatans]